MYVRRVDCHRFPGGKQSVSRAIDDSLPVAISCTDDANETQHRESHWKPPFLSPFSSFCSYVCTYALKREKLVCPIDSHAVFLVAVTSSRTAKNRFRVHFAADPKINPRRTSNGQDPDFPQVDQPGRRDVISGDKISNVGEKRRKSWLFRQRCEVGSVTKFIDSRIGENRATVSGRRLRNPDNSFLSNLALPFSRYSPLPLVGE